MSGKKLCICDYDEEYAERFSQYIWKHEGGGLTVMTFSKLSALREFIKTDSAGVYLAAEDFYRDALSGSRKIKFPEEDTFVLLSDNSSGEEFPNTLYKYSSAAENLRVLSDKLGLCARPAQSRSIQRSASKLIGIYSPCRRCGKTDMALALADMLSRSRRTVLVSFEDLCGTRALQKTPEQLGLSDVLYSYAAGETAGAFEALPIKREGELYILGAASCPEDIRQADCGILCELLARLAVDEGFARIVVDIGDALTSPWEVLAACDRIVVPQLEDEVSGLRLGCFAEEAKERLEDCESKLIRLRAPRGESELRQALAGLAGTFADEKL